MMDFNNSFEAREFIRKVYRLALQGCEVLLFNSDVIQLFELIGLDSLQLKYLVSLTHPKLATLLDVVSPGLLFGHRVVKNLIF